MERYQKAREGHDFEQAQEAVLLHQIFERQAVLTPSAIAVEHVEAGLRLTYRELDRRAYWLARRLRQRGVQVGSIVGIYMPRGIDQYIAMLAIMKAGGAYLPIDDTFPEDRVSFTLTDAKAEIVLTHSSLTSAAISEHCTSIYMDQLPWDEFVLSKSGEMSLVHTGEKPLIPVPAPEDLCYVIYTSGTTGRPKGVCISHLNAVTYVQAIIDVYGVKDDDRILQGFSTSFDASIEEIWMAFSSGSTLVVGTKEMMRSVDELGEKLRDMEISVFSTVPTLLSVMEHIDLPALRLLIVGGEATRDDVVEKWAAPHRQFLNGYGPTECTVVATYAWLEAGKPVTIGKPLPRYEAIVVNDALEEVPYGEEGELCIAGPGVSLHGYLYRPELNEKKFFDHEGQRFYRTGDLVWWNDEEELVYCGRIDTQVKIRGYRVELEEIETHLTRTLACDGAIVHMAKDEAGVPQLVAYIIQKSVEDIGVMELLKTLRVSLPDYMIPTHFVSLHPDDVPRGHSGKVNRRLLPPLEDCHLFEHASGHEAGSHDVDLSDASEIERKLHDIWFAVLHQPVGLNDSFFDFGGNSVMAAQVVTRCREDETLACLTIRDLYQFPRIQELAIRVEERNEAKQSQSETSSEGKVGEPVKVSEGDYRKVVTAQSAALLLIFATAGYSLFALLYFAYHITLWVYNATTWWPLVVLGAASLLPISINMVGVAYAFGLKWLVFGRFKEGDYPLWSAAYFRWWLANLLLAPVRGLANSFIGSPFNAFFYRILGAKIGRDVFIGSVLPEPDLVTIEDGATISDHVRIRTHSVEGGLLKLRRVHIGKNAYIGSQSIVGGGVHMEEGSKLHALSCFKEGFHAPAHSEWRGSPVVEIETGSTAMSRLLQRHEQEAQPGDYWSHWTDGLFIFVLQGIFSTAAGLAYYMPWAVEFAALLGLEVAYGAVTSLNLAILLPAALLFATIRFFGKLFAIIVAKWGLTGRAQAGTIRLNSVEYIRRWMCNALMQRLVTPSGTRGITETLLMPSVCRWLGMKVGKGSEISDAVGFQPDLVTIGDGCMLADQCILGVPVIHRGRMTLGHVEIGDRTFLANAAHAPITTPKIQHDSLIGVLSMPPDEMTESSDWLGSPPLRMPKRTSVTVDASLTFNPPRHMVWGRAVSNYFKMVWPGTVVEMVFWITLKVAIMAFMGLSLISFLLVLPLITIGANAMLLGAPIAMKWILIGRYKSGQKPLWCTWMWRSEVVYETELLILSRYMGLFSGTPYLAWIYRLLGAKIGKRACIVQGSLMEPDLVEIGDHVSIEGFLQTHLFEDRVMKLGHIKIDDGCSVKREGCVLYDSRMKKNAVLDDLSLIMKHETFNASHKYRGLPAENVL